MNFAASLAVLAVLNVTAPVASPEAVSSTLAQHARREPNTRATAHPQSLGGVGPPQRRGGVGASAAESRAGGGEELRRRGWLPWRGGGGREGALG